MKEGLYTTIQDLGRFSFKNIGIPTAGAMDEISFKLSNWLVFNHENTAVLECTYIGPELLFEEDALVAVGGIGFIPYVNKTEYHLFQPIHIKRGETLRLNSTELASRAYISVQGGFQIEKDLKSFSTYVRAQIGGIDGKALHKGDRIPTTPPTHIPKTKPYLSSQWVDAILCRDTIRFIKGNQADWFTSASYKAFQENSYTISPRSDRMGYRLHGVELIKSLDQELLTEGTSPGTIQIPPDGQPIVLMKDGQVTGGYPKIGTVISADMSVLGQKRPGDQLVFKEISLAESYQIKKELNQKLQWIKKRIELERRTI